MKNFVRAVFIILSFLIFHARGLADDSWNLLFDSGYLAELEPGVELVYDMILEDNSEDETSLRVLILEGENSVLTKSIGQRDRKIGEFNSSIGNPIALYFLEEIVKNMSKVTGGSPYYIRNRIRESFNDAEVMETTGIDSISKGYRITLKPFINDRNEIRMGNFVGMQILAVVSNDIVGGVQSLQVSTPVVNESLGTYNKSVKFRDAMELQ